MEPIYFEGLGSGQQQVNVHPVVLFTILDHHMRRTSDQDRVIGALLGTVTGGVVEITEAFGVYHTQRNDEEVLVRKQTLYDLLELHKKVNSRESLVGWYSTAGAGAPAQHHMDEFTLVVHEFFTEAATGPVKPLHLLVDVSLRTPHIITHAYKPVDNALLKRVMVQFRKLKVNIAASTEERVAIDAMARAAHLRDGKDGRDLGALMDTRHVPALGEYRDAAPDIDALESSLRRLRKLIGGVSKYCDEVAGGAREGDEAVGRAIADTLAAIPPFNPEAFDRTFGRSVQDLLMVAYLATLAQSQLRLAERIASIPN